MIIVNRRNLKAQKLVKALNKFGCKIIRKTSHGVIIENTLNKKSTNIPTHQEIIPVWIYNHIFKQLDIDKKTFEEKYLN